MGRANPTPPVQRHRSTRARTWRSAIWQRLVELSRSRRFAIGYAWLAAIILGATTLFWSMVGAFVAASNADQYANVFLTESAASFHQALLPAQHTFLLKLPLFWLISLLGSDPAIIGAATVILSLATVGGLAFLLFKIEKRPLALGTLLLALACVLLYTPAQSYPGSLLPLGMAMLTTRNIEYLWFIGAVIAIITAQRATSRQSLLGVAALTMLLASDGLFTPLSIGAALLGWLLALLRKQPPLARQMARLLAAGIIAWIVSRGLLAAMNASGLIHTAAAAGPYGLIHSLKALAIGSVYAVMGLLSNLGANPAFGSVVVKEIPGAALAGLLSPYGIGYLITLTIMSLAAVAGYRAFVPVVKKRSPRRTTPQWPHTLSLILLLASLVAVISFVVSDHYHPADARYLAIVLFAAFVGLARASSCLRLSPRLAAAGAICYVGILGGLLFQLHNLAEHQQVMSNVVSRNATVAAALRAYPVGSLLGNYWRVLPIKATLPTLRVTPLDSCTSPRRMLSSQAWQPDLRRTSFAYLLRLSGDIGNYGACSVEAVTKAYGQPDSSLVIAGTRDKPDELLLFYDRGIHQLRQPIHGSHQTATVLPMPIELLSHTTCPRQTIMQFVAHEDDDLLFMSPDLIHDIKAGNCIRSVYFTAGDAGGDVAYWSGRQRGVEAAYSQMLHAGDTPWTEWVVRLGSRQIVTIASPRDNYNISLVFLHLPDGSPDGSGFPSQQYESLRKLYYRAIDNIQSVDGSAAYHRDELVAALVQLMQTYQPAEVRTQSTSPGSTHRDHHDHTATGQFTTLAYQYYADTVPVRPTLRYYTGYPIHALPANVYDDDFDQKAAAFLAFGQFDGATCQSLAQCDTSSVYGIYLRRQYQASQ